MKGISIVGTGRYLPVLEVKNEEFSKVVETSDEWITTRTGIQSRHLASEETTWEMGAKAAAKALEDAKISPEEVDLLVVTTLTGDYYTPSVACLIQKELGAKNAVCFDLNAACSGFVYGLDLVRRYLATEDGMKTALLISAERVSQLINFYDRSTCVLFGDGAAACAIRPKQGLFASYLHSDGAGGAVLSARISRNSHPFFDDPAEQICETCRHSVPEYLHMDGREVYRFAVSAMPQALLKACEKLDMTPQQLDWVIPHQANIRIVQTAMKNLGLGMEKAYVNLQRYGNTSSSSIPIALDELAKSGGLKRGQTLAMVGFGGGLTSGAVILEW